MTTKLKLTKTELKNRKGEPNGKFRYEIRDAKGEVIATRESRHNYVSAARLYWTNGKVGGWVYSSKIFKDARAVASQIGFGPRQMSPGRFGWNSSAGRSVQKKNYETWLKEEIAGAEIVLISKGEAPDPEPKKEEPKGEAVTEENGFSPAMEAAFGPKTENPSANDEANKGLTAKGWTAAGMMDEFIDRTLKIVNRLEAAEARLKALIARADEARDKLKEAVTVEACESWIVEVRRREAEVQNAAQYRNGLKEALGLMETKIGDPR